MVIWFFEANEASTCPKSKNEKFWEFQNAWEKSDSKKCSGQFKALSYSFLYAVCDIMPMCENKNGGTCRHLLSWFTIDFVLIEYVKDTEERNIGMFYCTYYTFK